MDLTRFTTQKHILTLMLTKSFKKKYIFFGVNNIFIMFIVSRFINYTNIKKKTPINHRFF
jgi:hypothetical protein